MRISGFWAVIGVKLGVLFLVVAGPLEVTTLLTLSLGNVQGGDVENVSVSALNNRLDLLMDSHFFNKAFSF